MKDIKERRLKFKPDREREMLTLVLGMTKKEDEQEALALSIHGCLGLSKKLILIEAEREQRSDRQRRTQTCSIS